MSEFVVYTESPTDHARVQVIAFVSGYFEASALAKRVRAIVAYRDQFEARFTPTSPNRRIGILR